MNSIKSATALDRMSLKLLDKLLLTSESIPEHDEDKDDNSTLGDMSDCSAPTTAM